MELTRYAKHTGRGLESSMTPGEKLLLLVRGRQKPNTGTRSFLQPLLLQRYLAEFMNKKFEQEEKLRIGHRSIEVEGQVWFVQCSGGEVTGIWLS